MIKEEFYAGGHTMIVTEDVDKYTMYYKDIPEYSLSVRTLQDLSFIAKRGKEDWMYRHLNPDSIPDWKPKDEMYKGLNEFTDRLESGDYFDGLMQTCVDLLSIHRNATMEYRGQKGSIEYSPDTYCFTGNINGEGTAYCGDTLEELRKDFENKVDELLNKVR